MAERSAFSTPMRSQFSVLLVEQHGVASVGSPVDLLRLVEWICGFTLKAENDRDWPEASDGQAASGQLGCRELLLVCGFGTLAPGSASQVDALPHCMRRQ